MQLFSSLYEIEQILSAFIIDKFLSHLNLQGRTRFMILLRAYNSKKD